jgi:hypothetical protein
VLADIGHRFLHDPGGRRALGCRQLVQVARDLQVELGLAPPAKRSRVRFEDFPQIPIDESTRLEALRQVTKLLMEQAETCLHVLERSSRRSRVAEPLLDEPQIGEERRDVLHRPVVDVEAEPNETPLGDVEDLHARRGHRPARLSSRPIPWLYAQRTASARFFTSSLR